MTEVKWLDLYMPSHKCTVCGAMWRYFRAKDFPNHGAPSEDSWTLCSNTCGQCCDNVAMGEQIVPIRRKDAMEWLQAWAAVEAMKTQILTLAMKEIRPKAVCGVFVAPDEYCQEPVTKGNRCDLHQPSQRT